MVQHSLLAMLEFFHQGRITLTDIVNKMSHAPATRFSVSKRGFIREGYWADLVLVDLDNKVVGGKLNPSSDTKTHTVLYNNFLKIESIVHAHSEYAVAWAQAMKPIPILGTTHADHLTHEVPCTNIMSDEMIKGDYEEETGNLIIQTFNNLSYEEIEMVLVAGHGPFTWGKTAEKAVHNAVILEKLAKMAFLTMQINPDTPSLKKTLIDKHYHRKHGKDAYYGQKRI